MIAFDSKHIKGLLEHMILDYQCIASFHFQKLNTRFSKTEH